MSNSMRRRGFLEVLLGVCAIPLANKVCAKPPSRRLTGFYGTESTLTCLFDDGIKEEFTGMRLSEKAICRVHDIVGTEQTRESLSKMLVAASVGVTAGFITWRDIGERTARELGVSPEQFRAMLNEAFVTPKGWTVRQPG